jgi:hypothetical protein
VLAGEEHILLNWITRLFGSSNQRLLRRYSHIVAAANAFEPAIKALDDAALAFAVVREAAVRTIGMRHFDVQLIGGMAAARGQDRRDAHRRGQDAGRDPARLPECACPARACTS